MKLTAPPITKNFWYASTCTSFLTLGILLLSLSTKIYDAIVDHELQLGPDAPALESWKTPPAPLYLDLYLFNWTNPEEIYNPNSKPNFEQIGPYRFWELKEKINITWNKNDTVTYMLSRTWYFDEEGSARQLSDKITTVNIMLLQASKEVKNWSYWTKRGFSFTLGAMSSQLHITKTAKELLFDGYQDKLLDVVQSFSSFLSDKKFPEKLGFMYGRNATASINGVYNVATGANGKNGELLNWNYKSQTDTFKQQCGKVHGSTFDLFERKRSRSYVDVFAPEVCTALRLYYEDDVNVENIDGYKYSAGDKMFDNGTNVPENKCFLQGEELPSGLLNITLCGGVELYASLPHFYGADPVYLDAVDGLQPEKEKHDTYLTIEPNIGISLDLAFRFQLNFLLEPVESLTVFENVPRIFLPTIWFEQKYIIPEKLASPIRLLNNLPLILSAVSGVLIVLGIISLAYVAVLSMRSSTDDAKFWQINILKPSLILSRNQLKQEYV